MREDELTTNADLYAQIKGILDSSRKNAYKAVNFAMVTAYWHIGKVIVEDELHHKRAEYGKQVLKNIATRLAEEYGEGFDYRNLCNMRKFYELFPIVNALRPELN